MLQPKYKFYPSLLQSFQRFLDSEIDAEDFSNCDRDTGEYKRTADEIAAEREQALIDAINRVEREPSEAADKGTCLNEIVDCILLNTKSTRDDVTIRTTKVEIPDMPNKFIPCIQAKMHEFEFNFDMAFCRSVADYFKGSVPQHLCSAPITTKYGVVELYGYIDYVPADGRVCDLKSTSNYTFGKFANGWQKHVYPYCLIESGEMSDVRMFEYTVYQLKSTISDPTITGIQYREEYTYNHEYSTRQLRMICERFIEWLEAHKSVITDTKIFGGE